MLCYSMSALGAGMVMMLQCHHVGLAMMCSCQAGTPRVELSLVDEVAPQNCRNSLGCVCM